MNATAEARTEEQQPVAVFRQQLEKRLGTFAEALPPHISPERFKSVVAWAVMADPALLGADRISLFEACLAAANDGLLPDKKEAAFVIYNTKVKENGKEFWIKKVQYMPMIRGVFTKLYNTGKVKMAKVEVVYGGDQFRAWTDDHGDHIEYEEGAEQDRETIRAAFALVVMKESEGGGVFVQTMKPADIEKIRAKSKNSSSGPWADWWEEMAKKSVFRRLAKRLPMARDLEQVISRDDSLYELSDGVSMQRRLPPRPPELGAPVDTVQREKPAPAADANKDNGQSPEPHAGANGDAAPASAEPPPPSEPPTEGGGGNLLEEARKAGAEARAKGMNRKAVPKQFQSDQLREAWLSGFDSGNGEREPGEEG